MEILPITKQDVQKKEKAFKELSSWSKTVQCTGLHPSEDHAVYTAGCNAKFKININDIYINKQTETTTEGIVSITTWHWRCPCCEQENYINMHSLPKIKYKYPNRPTWLRKQKNMLINALKEEYGAAKMKSACRAALIPPAEYEKLS